MIPALLVVDGASSCMIAPCHLADHDWREEGCRQAGSWSDIGTQRLESMNKRQQQQQRHEQCTKDGGEDPWQHECSVKGGHEGGRIACTAEAGGGTGRHTGSLVSSGSGSGDAGLVSSAKREAKLQERKNGTKRHQHQQQC